MLDSALIGACAVIRANTVGSKLNKLVSYCDVKISVLKYGKYIDISLLKNVSSFCIGKATHIFAAKISMYLKIPYTATTVNKFVINELVKLTML